MRFVIAGGGVAGLAAALAVARAGHEAVVVERDVVDPATSPMDVFSVARTGIPHYLQPHAFLPRGRSTLAQLAPDVLQTLLDAGAHAQDLAVKLHGPPAPGDEDLVYLWARRPLVEWALRRAVASEDGVELRAGEGVAELLTDDAGQQAVGLVTGGGDHIRGDVVVDALGRYRTAPGWPRPEAEPVDSGAVYYCRYFELAPGVEYMDWPILNPRGDLGFMGFNTFRGDNRTFAVILLVPARDRALRVLRDERAWMAACSLITPLDVMTSPDYGRPITAVMPMGGLMNVDRTHGSPLAGFVAVGDAAAHTDPAFAYGLSFSLMHALALAEAAADGPDPGAVTERYRTQVAAEARERYELVCATDAVRSQRWLGEPLDIGKRTGCYPLFAFATALAVAPFDDHVLRRTVRRIGLLDRTSVFDDDADLHGRIEAGFKDLMRSAPGSPGPPRDDLLAQVHAVGTGRD